MSRAKNLTRGVLTASAVAAAVLLLCRILGWDRVTPVAQLIAFLPLSPVVLLVVAGAAMWLRAWPAALMAVSVGAVTMAMAWPLPGGGHSPSREGTRLTVLTANLQFGKATPALIGLVTKERPDVVLLQECTAECESLLNSPDMMRSLPHRTIIAAGGPEGSALLSAMALHAFGGLPGRLAMPSAAITVGGRDVALQVAHPVPPMPMLVGAWRHELGILARAAAAREGPMIIAGDFNATGSHSGFRRILATGMRETVASARTLSGTWPSGLPRVLGVRLDHVLVSPEITAEETRTIDLAGTDHRAVLATLRIAAP